MDRILGVILSIFIGFWLLGIVGRVLLKYWIVKKQRQMEQQMRDGGFSGGFQGFGGFYNGRAQSSAKQKSTSKPEGEITVEQREAHNKVVNKNIGEYVDYEEIK